jgi:phosphate transport system substrate-binding protein
MTGDRHHAIAHRSRGVAAAALALGLLALPAAADTAAPTLRETGSTLLYPLFQRWIPAYAASEPGAAIVAEATNSGAGIDQVVAGHADIGASDAYMSDEEAAEHRQIMNIPLAIAAQTVNYNVPELKNGALQLDGPTLAGIYAGTFRSWDAPEIAALNPKLSLPHQAIIPIRRSDPSGDTFVFTQFLDFSTTAWHNHMGYGIVVAWPTVPGELTATGNADMLKTLAATPYSLAYLGVSFHDDVTAAGLGTALLENQAGKFLLPTTETVTAAASELDPRTPPDERLSLVYAPGENSYPLINYEYAVVSARQSDPATAAALRRFLLWSVALTGGSAPTHLDAVHFIPLPDFIRALSEKQIARIQG